MEPGKWRHLQNYHILPLCRAIVVLFDELLPPPAPKADGLTSLDEEVQRRTAVMIITEDNRGLSSPISFDAIRSELLPLARSDVHSANKSHIIRVSLKVAVQSVAELQKTEETLAPVAADDDVDPIAASKFDAVFAAVESADEYVDGILNESAKNSLDQGEIRDALENIERTERGEDLYEAESDHWRGMWI